MGYRIGGFNAFNCVVRSTVQGRNVPKGAKEEEAKRDMREKGASGSSAFF